MGWLETTHGLEDIQLKCLVLGDYGTGKSWFASTFPAPLCVLDFDNCRLSYMRRAKKDKVFLYEDVLDNGVPITQRWSKFLQFLDKVITENPDGFKTLVLDSTTNCAEWLMELATTIKPLPPNTPPIWNIHYPLVKTYLHQILSRLKKFGGNVVCISHIDYEKDELTGEIKALPSLSGKLRAIVPGYFDEVYFAEAVGGGGKSASYRILLAPVGYRRARSRLRSLFPEIPEALPNDFNEIAKYIKQ